MRPKKFNLNILSPQGLYECKVEEHKEKKETYYLVDILSPKIMHQHDDVIEERIYNVEMRINCDGDYRIKRYFKDVPKELLKIEKRLSEALCQQEK